MKITTVQKIKKASTTWAGLGWAGLGWAGLDTGHALGRSSPLLRVLLGFYATAFSAGKQVQLERAISYLPEWKKVGGAREAGGRERNNKKTYHNTQCSEYITGRNNT